MNSTSKRLLRECIAQAHARWTNTTQASCSSAVVGHCVRMPVKLEMCAFRYILYRTSPRKNLFVQIYFKLRVFCHVFVKKINS